MTEHTSEALLRKNISPDLTATLTIDDHPSHPRDGDQVSAIVTWHERLSISERPDLPNPREFIQELYRDTLRRLPGLPPKTAARTDEPPYRSISQTVERHYPGTILNLFIDSARALSFRTARFTSHGDWDQAGYVYIAPDTMDNYNISHDGAQQAIQRELRIYEHYLNGRVYCLNVAFGAQHWEQMRNIYPDPGETQGLPADRILDSWLILMDIPNTPPRLIADAPWTSISTPDPTRHNLSPSHTL